MKSHLMELDPQGDLFLILKCPNLLNTAESVRALGPNGTLAVSLSNLDCSPKIESSTDFDRSWGFTSTKSKKKGKKKKPSILLEQREAGGEGDTSVNQAGLIANETSVEERPSTVTAQAKTGKELQIQSEEDSNAYISQSQAQDEAFEEAQHTEVLHHNIVTSEISSLDTLDALQPFGNDGTESNICYRVSSRHLSLVSKTFCAMLNGPWAEATPQPGSIRAVEAESWNAKALLHVLDIIHGHHRSVPKEMTFDLLVEIALIVDYYNCYEVCEAHVTQWISGLQTRLPEEYGTECILWISVAWIFSLDDIFEKMTLLAIRESTGPIEFPDIPIPSRFGCR